MDYDKFDYEVMKAKWEAKIKKSQEEIDAQNLEDEQIRENILKMIVKIKYYALNGSKLAQETVEYWNAQWTDKIHKRMVFKRLKQDMILIIEIIEKELQKKLQKEVNENN